MPNSRRNENRGYTLSECPALRQMPGVLGAPARDFLLAKSGEGRTLGTIYGCALAVASFGQFLAEQAPSGPWNPEEIRSRHITAWLGANGPAGPELIRHVVETRAGQVGIDAATAHKFRHTFIDAWLSRDGDIVVQPVQNWRAASRLPHGSLRGSVAAIVSWVVGLTFLVVFRPENIPDIVARIIVAALPVQIRQRVYLCWSREASTAASTLLRTCSFPRIFVM